MESKGQRKEQMNSKKNRTIYRMARVGQYLLAITLNVNGQILQ